MKRHLSIASMDRYAAGGVATEAGPASTLARAAEPTAWRHTLILQGSLDEHSGVELEDEVDCLYQEGVTDLRLDLRHLSAADRAGVRTLLALGDRCRARGQDVTVISGTHPVGSALADAGATDLLAAENAPGWPSGPILAGAGATALQAALSTTTVKDLARV
jgi:anti-anti-sigma regulatory factor